MQPIKVTDSESKYAQSTQKIIVTDFHLQNGKRRLDSLLSSCLHSSKNQIQDLIKNALVSVNGITCLKNGKTLKKGDCIFIDKHSITYSPNRNEILPNDSRFDIAILYEDEDLLIINKPPQLIIHEAPSVKGPTLTTWLEANHHQFRTLSGQHRYGIIHRLDKQTSGALVIAKSLLAFENLPKQLKSRQMGRFYLAIIDAPLKQNQIVRCFMGRNANNRLKMSKVYLKSEAIPRGVRDSHSAFVKLAMSNNNALELIAAKLYTGRTHQIRVHLDSLSRHILGDNLYGYKVSPKSYHYAGRILLHAYILYLTHPRTAEKLYFQAPILQDMLQFLTNHFTQRQDNAFNFNTQSHLKTVLQPKHILREFDRI